MPEIPTNNPDLTKLKGIHLWHAGLSTCSQRVRIALSELDLTFTSHTVNLHAGENASEWYQAIHPDGVVPALVDNGHLIIESIDIINYLGQKQGHALLTPDDTVQKSNMFALMKRADDAQKHLKLLTYEFLFKAAPTMNSDQANSFQNKHKNEALRRFHREFRAGFERNRIENAATASAADFKALERLLSDERAFLAGPDFSLADISWTPIFHRFDLLAWPFERYPYLRRWFRRVSSRPSYAEALQAWEPRELLDFVAPLLVARSAAGDGIETYITV